MDHRRTGRQLFSRRAFPLKAALVGALALVGAAELSDAPGDAALFAQSIINKSNVSSNRFVGFSTQSNKKIALCAANSYSVGGAPNDPFDAAERLTLDLPAPKAVPKEIDGGSYSMPFSFPQNANSTAATSIELLCSDDQGESWFVYDSVDAVDTRSAFEFEAPAPGEYWFALKTHFTNGKAAYSSTRAYQFNDDLDDFALNDDAPPLLQLHDDPLYIEETSAQEEEAAASESFALAEPKESEYETADPNLPRVGKLKSASFGKEEESGKLLVIVRWFKADELAEQYRGTGGSLTIEHGPTPTGPWEPVGKNLSLKESGYSWYATKLNMEPFYVRLIVTDETGKSVAEVSCGALDANHPDVRKSLEPVKTPVPFKDLPTEKTEEAKHTSKYAESAEPKEDAVALIGKTSAEKNADDDEKVSDKASDIERSRSELKTTDDKKTKPETKQRCERPNIPAPTNPNQLTLNPLFTRGPGVLYRSAQTRHPCEEPSGAKRSIFTPPSYAARAAAVPPAQRLQSSSQIAMAQAKEARERYEKQARQAQENEMAMFEEKPELMEGRVFYMDEAGNMTTTPPAEFLQAQNQWQLTDVGEPVPVDGAQIGADAQVLSGSNAEPPIYMPSNTDLYDASARSGAAILPGNPGSSSSPINQRYDAAPNTSTPNGAGVSYQSFPQTSYSQSFTPGAIPYNYNAAPSPAYFPPRPNVSR